MDLDEFFKAWLIMAIVYGFTALISAGVSIWAIIYVVTHIGGWIS